METIWPFGDQPSRNDRKNTDDDDDDDDDEDDDDEDDDHQDARPTGKEEEWQDITQLLIEGTNHLGKNEVLIKQDLKLIDIISAIQIMDPRMDVGFGRSLESNLKNNLRFDPTQSLLPSEVIAIIDLSLAYEVTWYTGRLLSQTVLMSTYLHHLDQLKDHPNQLVRHVLRSYLLGLIKCCSIVSEELLKGHVRENEDVNSEHQDIDLYEHLDVSKTLDQLDLAHAILNRWPDELSGHRIPLMERVRFRIEYLYSLALLSCSPSTSTIPRLHNHLKSATEALECMRLYNRSDQSILFSIQSDRVRSAFNLNFNQNVSSNSPPRPIQYPQSFQDLIDSTKRILEELNCISQIALSSSFSDWISFFQAFSRRDPMAFPFARSYLLSLFQDGNVIALNENQTLVWLARQSLSNLSSGRVYLESNGVEIRYILNRLAGLIVNHLSCFAANRARGRRLLLNSLEGWKALYNSTAVNRLDISPSILQALQTLIYYMSTASSLQAVLMGFDLDLYEEGEDRVRMWWVVERLSERNCQLLNILSGGLESPEERINRIVGKLAGVASQIVRQKNRQVRGNLKSNRRAIFERRIKYFTTSKSSFDNTNLIDELGLSTSTRGSSLLNYQLMMDTRSLNTYELDLILEDLKNQLIKISIEINHLHPQKVVGVNEFKLFIKSLMDSTEMLIVRNRDQGLNSTLEKLEISTDDQQQQQQQQQQQPGEDIEEDICNKTRSKQAEQQEQGREDDNSVKTCNYVDLSTKWFIV